MRDSRALRALLSLGMVVGLGATGTYAYWTDTVSVTGTTITAGTIDLKVNNSDTVTDFTTMNVTTMVPGDSTAGVVTVKNSGTAPLKYYVDASPSNADGKGLGAALAVKVTGDSATSGSGTGSHLRGGRAVARRRPTFTASMLGSAAIAAAARRRRVRDGVHPGDAARPTPPAPCRPRPRTSPSRSTGPRSDAQPA